MDERALLRTLTKVVTTLSAEEVEFAVAGGLAVYARGGPPSEHDVDIFLLEQDVETATRALVAAGMRPEDPPENWLRKVYDGNVLVDLIFRPNYRGNMAELLARAEPLRIGPALAPVLDATDLMVDKLLVLTAHRCDFTPLLPIARGLREQIDWDRVAAETAGSPYAQAFLTLVEGLSVAEVTAAGVGAPDTAEGNRT
ncbi:nucleotidyltransferase family protein [Amycolatopsis cynarae]|uniref:Nucleotidyltransferase family protein n=1 Tax=Amycolatopsis cynarae TaxID=2995223 RepID=A0ABY7AVA0_9PSEU|nr:nucleotidyltransferase family protein [Amycolatopsis sp. HUAS 11-8]WAL63605.1 nucleotidyltransferase family protein [Amycolatopsis sp. HUAS 11-8]